MGVRNEAAVAASIGASTTRSMTEANTTATSTATMAVNDNAHLSLAELQQMAAYQQQQIQAQQSLLMAKVSEAWPNWSADAGAGWYGLDG